MEINPIRGNGIGYSYFVPENLILKMKLLTLFFFITLSHVWAVGYGQKISLNKQNISIASALKQIENQSEYLFLYDKNEIQTNTMVTIKANDTSIEETLDMLFSDLPIAYKVFGKNVVLRKTVLNKSSVLQQTEVNFKEPETPIIEVTIRGKVTDENGEELLGVSVLVKGTTNGTVTDLEGKFELTLPTQPELLVVSYIGYLSQEVSVGNRSVIDVRLVPDPKLLEEIVVVGYGTQKKANLTGAVGVAKAERLENRPIANLGEGLQGVIPNLNITVRNGDPSGSPTFNVRGFTSINGGEPLVLVDNVPMNINRVNPNDIESVTVLKDAAAAAIYGARAAFGVILVETKKAKSGKMNISLNTQMSLGKPILNMNPITDPYEYVTTWNDASNRTTGTPLYSDYVVQGAKNWSENPTTENAWGVEDGVLKFFGNNNYKNELITDYALSQQHDLSISGGSDNASYYSSFGYLKKDGYLKVNNSSFERYNLLMKVEYKANKWLQLNQQISFNSQQNDRPTEYSWDAGLNSVARAGTVMPVQFPDLPYYVEEGDREKYEPYIGKYFGGTNAFPYLMEGGRESYTNNDLWLTTGATANITKKLKVVSNLSYQVYNRTYENVRSKVDIISDDLLATNAVQHGFSDPDYIENESYNTNSYVFNVYGAYKTSFLTDHNFAATVGYNQEWSRSQSLSGTAYTLITPSVPNIHATTGSKLLDGSASHYALRGAFSRLSYNYKERYLLEANGRYDGTSRFAKDGRFGFFPSFSAGWRLSSERFMQGTEDWLDNLKIRASYGELGNQLLGTDYYPYISTMNSGVPNTYPLILSGSTASLNILWPNLVSPSLSWEKVASKNLGVDLTLLKSRLDVSFDIYTRDTKDMLISKTYPDILGAAAPKENAADLRTKGWEVSATWRDRNVKNDFSYDVTLSLSDWTSEITKYENPGGSISDYYVGKQIGEIWGFETVGIFQNQADIDNAADQSQIGNNWRPGDIQYADLNNDNVISGGSGRLDDHGDLKRLGNSNPRYQYGINVGLQYKNWGFTSFFQGIGKIDVWPSTNSWTWFYPYNSGYLESSAIENSWSEENRDAYFPAPALGYSSGENKNYVVQSRFLQQGAYIRLKATTLSYNLPKSLISKIGVGNLRVYFSGMNLWEFSKIRKPLDPESIPEVTSGTVGAIEYPMQRSYSFGANISF